MNFPFFRLKPDRIDEIATLRDRALMAETKVLLLADIVEHRQPSQPRDEAGRFVSKRAKVREQLEQYRDSTTPAQRKQEAQAFFDAKRDEAKAEQLRREMGR